MRYAIVKGKGYWGSFQEMFSAIDLNDSEFLHYILSVMDPPNDYTVVFSNTRPRKSSERRWFTGNDPSNGVPDFRKGM